MGNPLSSDPADPSALVSDALAGDPEGIEAWYRAEHPRVYRLCFGFLADATEAEDLTQDAMLHLLDKLPAWDAQRSYSSWRNAVVLNQCRDRLRRLDARRRAEDGAAEVALPAALPEPHAEAERTEVREILAACLGRLSPREREAFVLRDLEGISTAAVAAAMEVTEASVRSLLTLARRRLRGLLGERLAGFVPGSEGAAS